MKQLIFLFVLVLCTSCFSKKRDSANSENKNEEIQKRMDPVYLKGEPLFCDSTNKANNI